VSATDDELTESLRAQILALNAGDRGRRRQFVAYTIRCGNCGDLVIEVLKTSPHWSVLFRWAEGEGSARTVRPLDGRVFHPLFPEDKRLLRIPANCSCTTGAVFLGPIRDSMARGETSAILRHADRTGHFTDGIRGSFVYG
jgi:hypothetical protein